VTDRRRVLSFRTGPIGPDRKDRSGVALGWVAMEIQPAATDEEAAAIAAAVEALWPKPLLDGGAADRRPSVWKFSGRWWSQPIPLRRARPWV
jgi:hypothetical protein